MHTAPSPRRYGDYVLLEPLGKGGMSAVDLARRTVDGAAYVRFLVIKRILRRNTADPTFVRMFMDEARINAELQHENIAQVYDFGERDGEWYLAMEYIPGIDLRRLQKAVAAQKEGGALLPPRISLKILHDVLSALQYAHNRVDTYGQPMRIVHRDVNPRNIMVSVRGEVKLIDFGVAKADNRQDQTTGQTIKGKFAYMAPEQVESPVPVDGRADLFAVGLCFQELLTGTHPFRHLSEIQIIHRLMSARIEPMPECPLHPDPPAVQHVRDRALAASPTDRYPDARAFQADLERLAAPLGGLATRAELAGFFRRAAPDAAAAIAQRLESWRHAKSPPATPPMLAVPPGADLNDDTWASDMRTAEVPIDHSLSRSRSQADTDATVADSAARARQLAVASPDTTPPPTDTSAPSGSALADLTEQSASSVVLQVPPRRSSLPVVAAIVIGGGLGLGAIAVMAVIFLSMTPPAERVVAPAPVAEAQARPDPPPSPEPAQAAALPPPEDPTPPSEPKRASNTRPQRAPSKPPTPKNSPPPPKEAPPEAVPEPAAPPEPAPEATETEPEPEAKPAPAPAAKTGFVFATSRPSGLEVLVDGRSLGRTPVRNAVLPIGSHTVTFRDPETGTTVTKSVTVRENQPSHVKVSQ